MRWDRFAKAAFVALMLALPIKAALAIYPYAPPNASYVAPSGGGGCSQSTTFLARTSGLSGTESGAYSTMICGMVADGTWPLLDALYIFSTNTTTTANLNLISTSYGLSQSGTVTFSADNGYTGDGSTGFFTTGFTPSTSGGNLSRNSTTIGSCVLTNSTSPGAYSTLGTIVGTAGLQINPLIVGNEIAIFINDTTANNSANSNSQGSLIATRTSNTARAVYQNGSLLGSDSDTSVGLPTVSMYILAVNHNGITIQFLPWQVAYAFWGASMTGTQITAMYNRLHTFLSTVGAASGC